MSDFIPSTTFRVCLVTPDGTPYNIAGVYAVGPFDPSNTARVLLVDENGDPYTAGGGGGGGPTIQVEGVNTSNQNLVNFVAGTPNVTIDNPSGGIVEISVSGGGGSGTVTQVDTTAPIQGGPITTTGTISITQASAISNGFLSSTDWNTFNNKQAAGNYLVDPGGNGVVVRTALNTTTNRTITGTSNRVVVTNGDGVAGNPTLTVPDSAQLNIAKVVNLTTNGIVRVGSGDGTLSSAELSGDVTTSGSNATTIANNAVTTVKILDANVTYAKIQDVSAASKLLGRGDSGAGDVQEITLGTGLSMSGTTLNSSGGSGDIVAPLTSAEISITTTATATISRMHVISGTSANYTVTLPAASGNANKFVGLRIAPTATKLFTIDGDGSETIDGELTRIMWAAESAILFCDGSNWFKVAGKSRAMLCTMHLSSNQTGITTSTMTKVNVDTTDLDNTGLMADTGNSRINIVRPNNYSLEGTATMSFGPSSVRVISQVRKNDSQIAFNECSATGIIGAVFTKSAPLSFAVGDHASLAGYQQSGGDGIFIGDTLANGAAQITVTELPSW